MKTKLHFRYYRVSQGGIFFNPYPANVENMASA